MHAPHAGHPPWRRHHLDLGGRVRCGGCEPGRPEAATSSEQTASANPPAPERVAAPAAVAPEHLPACNATALADSSTALETATVSQGGDG
jgi:hypothetical protein